MGGPANIGPREPGVIGAHAAIPGADAAQLLRLLPSNWRARLVLERVAGDDLRSFEATVAALESVASAWRAEQLDRAISPSGNPGEAGEGQRQSGSPESRAWITTAEAADILHPLSARRVRQLGEEGALVSSLDRGRRWFLLSSVLAYSRLRQAA